MTAQEDHMTSTVQAVLNLKSAPMPDDLDCERFHHLLEWLDNDSEKAGAKYEWIRKRLITIFTSRGSTIPEELADRTIDRVARKLPEIRRTYIGDPAHYFCGVAGYIFRESRRKDKGSTTLIMPMPAPATSDDDEEELYSRLDRCLDELPAVDRDLLVAYYRQDKQAKIESRKQLAVQFGVGMNALRIRACRIRADLQNRMLQAEH